jgi:hypothetical protein
LPADTTGTAKTSATPAETIWPADSLKEAWISSPL